MNHPKLNATPPESWSPEEKVTLSIDDKSVIVNGFELPGVVTIAYEEPDTSGVGYLTVKIRIDSREITKKGGSLTFEEIAIACRNVGINLECGGCASAFFTGYVGDPHDENCTQQSSCSHLFGTADLVYGSCVHCGLSGYLGSDGIVVWEIGK